MPPVPLPDPLTAKRELASHRTELHASIMEIVNAAGGNADWQRQFAADLNFYVDTQVVVTIARLASSVIGSTAWIEQPLKVPPELTRMLSVVQGESEPPALNIDKPGLPEHWQEAAKLRFAEGIIRVGARSVATLKKLESLEEVSDNLKALSTTCPIIDGGTPERTFDFKLRRLAPALALSVELSLVDATLELINRPKPTREVLEQEQTRDWGIEFA